MGIILTILKELKLKNVILSRPVEENEIYNYFIRIINKNRINLMIVNEGDEFYIEKDSNMKVFRTDINGYIYKKVKLI
jgi:hypothetical protein